MAHWSLLKISLYSSLPTSDNNGLYFFFVRACVCVLRMDLSVRHKSRAGQSHFTAPGLSLSQRRSKKKNRPCRLNG